MRKRAILGSLFSAAAILIAGWEFGATVHAIPVKASTSQAEPMSSGASSTAQATQTTQSAAAPSTQSVADGSYLGESSSTRFGQVQVQVAVVGGSITDVTAVHLTDADGRSVQISNRAAPVLREEVLSSQSANVQIVSGATYTSEAYLTSLQSALDQAGF